MSVKRKIGYGIGLFLLLLLCVFLSVILLIPPILNSESFSQKVRGAGFDGLSWKVRRIGLYGADIVGLRLGPKGAPSIKSVRMDYAPGGLYKRRIQSIQISGVEFYCGFKDGNFFIRGIDPQAISAGVKSEKTAAPVSEGSIFPVSVENIEISDASVVFVWEGGRQKLPFKIALSVKKDGLVHGVANAFPRAQEVTTDFEIDFHSKKIRFNKIDAFFILDRFGDIASRIPGLSLSGKLKVSGSAEFRLKPFQISTVRLDCTLRDMGSAYKGFRLKPTDRHGIDRKAVDTAPIRFGIQSDDGKIWAFSASSAVLIAPAPIRISGMNALLHLTREQIKCAGALRLESEKSDPNQPRRVKVAAPIITKWNFSGAIAKGGDWEVNLESAAPDESISKRWEIRYDGIGFSSGAPDVKIEARGTPKGIRTKYNTSFSHIYVSSGNAGMRVPALLINLEAHLGDNEALQASVKFSASDVNIKTESLSAGIPRLVLAGTIRQSPGGIPQFDGLFKIDGGSLRDPSTKTRVAGINAAFPFQWPWKHSSKKGKVFFGPVKSSGLNLGSFSGSIQQSEPGVDFKGNHKLDLIPGFKLKIKGHSLLFSRNKRSEVSFESRYRTVSPMNLGDFHPGAVGVEATGELTLKGELIADHIGLRCAVDTVLDRAGVVLKKSATSFENIRMNFSMPDLLKLRSAPRQQLRIGRISMGNIHLSDAVVDFQIESDRSVLIEQTNFKWCGGRISSLAMRIEPGVEDYELVLYCDRIKLDRLLEQLGVARAEGEGEVSGRIHVRFKDGEIRFDDGFLFSTPGEEGTIHVKAVEMLTSGIPKSSPQYAQMELAREALKDYQYKWVRLKINTEGENLVLRLTFDGKPANPLPFVYKKEFGGFVRDTTGKRFSNFQGIRLNVNLGLPLNKILRYKGVLDAITN
jgi:hypothetical protein